MPLKGTLIQFPGNDNCYPLICNDCDGYEWGILFTGATGRLIDYVQCLGCGFIARLTLREKAAGE